MDINHILIIDQSDELLCNEFDLLEEAKSHAHHVYIIIYNRPVIFDSMDRY